MNKFTVDAQEKLNERVNRDFFLCLHLFEPEKLSPSPVEVKKKKLVTNPRAKRPGKNWLESNRNQKM